LRLAIWHDDDDLTQLRAGIVPRDGALVEALISSASEHLKSAACIADVPAGTFPQVDALVESAGDRSMSAPY